jgi:ankyrin repeat protein
MGVLRWAGNYSSLPKSGGVASQMKRSLSAILAAFFFVPSAFAVPKAEDLPPLFRSAAMGDVLELRRLLALGEGIASRDEKCGATALHWAVVHDQTQMIQEILSRDGDPNDMARGCGTSESAYWADWSGTPMHWGMWGGTLSLQTLDLLIKYGADVNALDVRGHPPIMYISKIQTNENWRKVIDFLLDAGASVEILDPQGKSAILISHVVKPDILAVLLTKTNGAFLDRDVMSRRRSDEVKKSDIVDFSFPFKKKRNVVTFGLTPLFHAVALGQVESVKLLLSAGSDAEQYSSDGESLADYASRGGYYDIANLLRENSNE